MENSESQKILSALERMEARILELSNKIDKEVECQFQAREVLERLDRQMDLIIRNLPAIAKVAGTVEAQALDRKFAMLKKNNNKTTVIGKGT